VATTITRSGFILRSEIIGSAVDQGATISVKRRHTWSFMYNQPTAQLYHSSPTTSFPYGVTADAGERSRGHVPARSATGRN